MVKDLELVIESQKISWVTTSEEKEYALNHSCEKQDLKSILSSI